MVKGHLLQIFAHIMLKSKRNYSKFVMICRTTYVLNNKPKFKFNKQQGQKLSIRTQVKVARSEGLKVKEKHKTSP